MTAKLVKARPKAVEYLPEWAKCCDQAVKRDQALGEIMVNLADVRVEPAAPCKFCGVTLPKANEVMIASGIGSGYCFPIEMLDIDEGPTA